MKAYNLMSIIASYIFFHYYLSLIKIILAMCLDT